MEWCRKQGSLYVPEDEPADFVILSREEYEEQEATLSEMTSQMVNEQALNQNLLRIMRERANAKRHLRPKKQRDGYVVLESRPWREKYMVDVWLPDVNREYYETPEQRQAAMNQGLLTRKPAVAMTWRTLLQTPYDASLPFNAVQQDVERAWQSILINVSVTAIAPVTGEELDQLLAESQDDNDECILYRWTYRANFRSGMWEIELFTTAGLTVTADHRPASYGTGKC